MEKLNVDKLQEMSVEQLDALQNKMDADVEQIRAAQHVVHQVKEQKEGEARAATMAVKSKRAVGTPGITQGAPKTNG